MRKSEAFMFASRHATESERLRFLERADFFFRSSTDTLLGMPTRVFTRPVVLMLTNGFMRSWIRLNSKTIAPAPERNDYDFGQPAAFIPQKARVRRVLIRVGIAAALSGVLVAAIAWTMRA
jgi:hypothetical protein